MHAVARIAGIALFAAGAVLAREPAKDIGHLWQVSRPGVPDSYVFGTIHVADPRVAAIAAPVRDALARSPRPSSRRSPPGRAATSARSGRLPADPTIRFPAWASIARK